jgi:IS4 transposase
MQELMKAIPRGAFDRLVGQHQADKHSKGFGCWDQLVAMVYAQLGGAGSLRELAAGFNSQTAHHYHLGTSAIRRSTLAEANAKRSPALFEAVAKSLLAQAGRTLRQEGQALLYLLDSTSITLKGRGFDTWTQDNRTCHSQGIKLHVLYAAHEEIPTHCSFSPANVNDIAEGRKLAIERDATYVFDKGYCDYNWWAQIDAKGARFVTRFKRNARLQVVRSADIPLPDQSLILEDCVVRFANPNPGAGRRNRYTEPLRRIAVRREDKAQPLILATNDLQTPAVEIAERYKDRWQIELFFKWIKQHLKIRRFLGRSENAVRIQILCALIAYLLLALYRKAHGVATSLWALLSELRATLFQRPSVEYALHRKRQERIRATASLQRELFA